MTSLFSVFKNHLFVSVYHVLRAMEHGRSYTPEELHDALYGAMSFHPVIEDAIASIIDLLFITDHGQAVPRLSVTLPDLPPSLVEKEWLKTMLHDQTCEPFFPGELRKKLETILHDVSVLPLPAVFGDETTQEPVKTCLSLFQQSLLAQVQVRLTYADSQQQIQVQPVRLDYNLQKRYFSYLVYHPDQGFQRIAAKTFQTVTLLSQIPVQPDIQSLYQAFLTAHKTSLTLVLSPKWNAVERCFLLFSSYEKEAVYAEDTDRYTLTIYFYDFDTDAVLNDIFSLGSAVTLIKPESLRQQIISRLLASAQWYQKDLTI